MNFEAFVAAFVLVGLAELGDKTQLAALMLVSQYKKPARVLLGVLLAFVVADGLAVFFGSALTAFLPMEKIRLAASAVFVLIGISLLLEKRQEKEGPNRLGNVMMGPIVSAFLITLMAEMGDKTQLSAAVLSARYGDPLSVLAGLLLGVALVNGSAIFAWSAISRHVEKNMHLVKKLFGLVFILAGVLSAVMAL